MCACASVVGGSINKVGVYWSVGLTLLRFGRRMEPGYRFSDHEVLEEDYDENYEPTEEGENE